MSILEKLIAMKPPVEGGVTVELNGGITTKNGGENMSELILDEFTIELIMKIIKKQAEEDE